MKDEPAFPFVFTVLSGSFDPVQGKKVEGDHQHIFGGISARDYFAAAALTGLLAGQSIEDRKVMEKHGIQVIPTAAFKIADAMLAERAKTL